MLGAVLWASADHGTMPRSAAWNGVAGAKRLHSIRRLRLKLRWECSAFMSIGAIKDDQGTNEAL
jgi:hypothetical protein